MKKNIIAAALVVVAALGLTGCASDAVVTSENLSTAADNFEVQRQIVFYNSITDTVMYQIEGACSIEVDQADNQLEVICKIGPDEYVKNFLGLADNVTYLVLQPEGIDVDEYHYRFIIKPEVVIPTVDVNIGQTDTGD